MKKQLVLIAVVVVVVVLGFGAVWGKNYYQNRYVGSDYYTMVPLDYDMTEQTIGSMKGDPVGTGIRYNLTAYSETREKKSVSFTVYNPNSPISLGEQQPQPGTYLKVKASKTIVISWSVIDKSQVPHAVLAAIQAG